MYQSLPNNQIMAVYVPLITHDFGDEATKGTDHDKSI